MFEYKRGKGNIRVWCCSNRVIILLDLCHIVMCLWIAFVYCFVIACECRSDVAEISDEDFKEAKESGETFSIYFYSDKVPSHDVLETVLKTIEMSQRELETQEIRLGVVNCDKSRISLCQEMEHLGHVIVFKEGEPFATIEDKHLQTASELQTYMRHYAGPYEIDEVMNKEELKEIQKKFAGKNDLIIFHIPYLGSIDHQRMLDTVMHVSNNYEFFYTFNNDLFDDQSTGWYLDCMTSVTEECQVKATSNSYDDKDFKDVVKRFAAVSVLQQSDFPQTLKEMVNKGSDVLVLIAGPRKFQDALALARKVTSFDGLGVHVLVVDGTNSLHKDLQSRVENDKIFAIVSPRTAKNPRYINIGFLENEEVWDVIDEASIALSRRDKVWVSDATMEKTDEDSESDHYIRPEEAQDDPISFSIHRTKHVKDLYYFDYKTLPRLTDKTYEAITQSQDYAVILFTLEFNPKALAALVTFAEIHNAYKGMGKESPMHRVECYNWPDVCQKAGVYTSPRMFFYPAGSTNKIEYTGMWEKAKMMDAITRYSSPSVIIVRKKEDILPYLPVTVKAVVGLFETDNGTAEFRKAAETLRNNFQFIELHGHTAKFVANQFEVEYADQRLLAFENSFPKNIYGTFKKEQDVLDFCKLAFAAPELQELTIHSFVDILKREQPVLIFFWDQTDGSKLIYHTEIKNTIEEIADHGQFANRVLFTWMNLTESSTGQFVLERYNHKADLDKPIVAFFNKKGSVILRSCSSEDCHKASLISWLLDCIDGRVEPSFALNTDEWKPRLHGYDFLEMMKDDGTYPAQSFLESLENYLDEDGKKGSKVGRTVADKLHRPKIDQVGTMKKREEEDPGNQESHATHTEL